MFIDLNTFCSSITLVKLLCGFMKFTILCQCSIRGSFRLINRFRMTEGSEATVARLPGVDRNLVHTVATYNEHAAKGEDPVFHKESCWLQPLATPPFAAIDLRAGSAPYAVFTLGGLRTDAAQQVLDADGVAVAGLYAAGRTASGIPAQGYNSGLSLGDCTFSGRVAGASAATA